jgi:hypothetical protein
MLISDPSLWPGILGDVNDSTLLGQEGISGLESSASDPGKKPSQGSPSMKSFYSVTGWDHSLTF